MRLEKYADLIKKLEDDELESSSGAGAELYIQLLAAYIYENDLSNAKYIWKRIPQSIKTGNKELDKLCLLALALVNNNTPECFKIISYAWPQNIAGIMKDLEEKIRKDVFTLVGKAYTSIYEANLLELTQLSAEDLIIACDSLDWKIEKDAQQTVIRPKRSINNQPETTKSEDQLFKLTEFVSFLEN